MQSIYVAAPCEGGKCARYDLNAHQITNAESCGCTMRSLIAEFGSQALMEKNLVKNDANEICVNPRRKQADLQLVEGQPLNRHCKIRKIKTEVRAFNKVDIGDKDGEKLVWRSTVSFDKLTWSWTQPYLVRNDVLEYISYFDDWYNFQSDEIFPISYNATITGRNTSNALCNFCPVIIKLYIDYDIIDD